MADETTDASPLTGAPPDPGTLPLSPQQPPTGLAPMAQPTNAAGPTPSTTGMWKDVLAGALSGLAGGANVRGRGGFGAGMAAGAENAQRQQQIGIQNRFQSVQAADSHILASRNAQLIAAETEEHRTAIAKDQMEANAFADQQGYPHPFATISGDNHADLSNKATGAMQANAARNDGQIGPVTMTTIPHSADNADQEIHGRQIILSDLTTNPTGVLKAINDGQLANGQLPFGSIDDAKQHYRMTNPKAPMGDLLNDANAGMTRMISPLLPTKDVAADTAKITALTSQSDFAAQYAKEHPEYQATADRLKSQLGTFTQLVKDEQAGQAAAKQRATLGDGITKMESSPDELAKPGAQASIQAMLKDPNLDPNDAARVQALLPKAQVAQTAQLAMDKQKKTAEQAIEDGDPKSAGQLLVSGVVAPSQLVSSRKPEFAQKAFSEAQKLQPGWSAQKADADFKVASSPAQVAFFGSAKSLTDPGGTLDQLKAAGKDIPDGKIPVFNTVADALKASTGSGPIAKYAAIALGVADDYAKVMGGGTGSDSARNQALSLVSANQSPDQRAASIEGIRGSVASQTKSRVGGNAVMQQMYGASQASGPLSLSEAQSYLQKAGGDKDKARALAKTDGRTF